MIDVIMRRNAELETGQAYYEVQIGPNDHVCSEIRRFWIGADATEDEAWLQANAFKNGAAAALSTTAGLTDRFIRGGAVITVD